MDLSAQAAGIGALADDTRRALYEYVSAQAEPVGREQAATELGVAVHNVNFHLDRLVTEGLLEVEYRRLSGKTGPGAGRPSKLYRRASREFAVSLPPRRYELVGDILAAAVSCAAEGVPLDQALHESARREGLSLAQGAEKFDRAGSLPALAQVLRSQGFEPQVRDDEVVLSNCPFDALAQKHTALVCGLNQSFVQGVADSLGSGITACLEPEPGRCCVKARRASAPVRQGEHPGPPS
ncbi:ArsR family transcriptional regulator [Nocardioides psychrotolerans]|uniref:Predicted transcriptional regulator, ArsR family n=1 Tax=Nocardioides psychrotolerans TaxID=1005945 RepID=A0A1I3RCF9_9ACTN|nr:helix-turn-helix domain-containing protein [Nocardioides psychrotolerans]GEP40358.1 ArsR family transcriptional regulator [Nocardioides psychrotolerans]SFJ43007.1 Predicted transcriptional regulator, ArsR family [Nocardioides psychrotolerans]